MESVTINYWYTVDNECRDIDLDRFLLKSKNTSDLLRIQEIMSLMEGRPYTIDQVLERMIRFYGKFIALN